ncbi:MAG: ABC transporter permease [Bowdeniella nasicola]|nr:ABC transporter permease [Bowdeniella nasicola]
MDTTTYRGRLPAWIYLLAVAGLLALLIPLIGLGTRVPFAEIPQLMSQEDARAALWLSLKTCLISTALAVLLGIPTATLLAGTWRGVKIARVIVLLPMALPPVVAGLALLQTFGRRGLVGTWLSHIGIEVGFTTTAVIMAQTFVSMPFLIVALQGALRVREAGYEAIAATLGARPTRIFTRVTLPLVWPAIAQGTALALARSLGEFGATLTFAGSLSGVTRTMPLEIYLRRETDPQIALALAAVLIVVAIMVVAVTAWQYQGARPPRRIEPCESDERTPTPAPDRPVLPGGKPPAEAITANLTLAERHLDVDLQIPAGEVVALLGPNGSGKSTSVQIMTGLLNAPGSQVTVGGRQLQGEETNLAPHARNIALLAQKPLLFPHLSARDNVAFGLRSRGMAKAQARARADDELAAVGAAHLADRRPAQLSGGQAARVALARALATNPHVVFLDEPMAALDVDAAAHMRRVLAARFANGATTAVIVTHNLLDVARLATRVVVLDEGKVVEEGETHEVLSRPRTPFAAALAGMNMAVGQVSDITADELVAIRCGAAELVGVAAEPLADGTGAVALFAPAAVSLYPQDQTPQGSPRNVFAVRVMGVEQAGQLVRVSLRIRDTDIFMSADLTVGSVQKLGIDIGVWMHAVIKAAEVSVVARP